MRTPPGSRRGVAGSLLAAVALVVTAVPASAATYSATVLAASPTVYWRLGEAAGVTTAADSSPTNLVGTYQNAPTRGVTGSVAGDANTAVTFNGATQYISSALLAVGPNVFSEEAWFRTTTLSGGVILGFESSSTGASATEDRVTFMSSKGTVVFGVGTAPRVEIQSPQAYNDGLWHHVVTTVGATGSRLYMDGVKVAQSPGSVTPGAYNGYVRAAQGTVGAWPGAPASTYFAGTLDELALYTTELSAAQVATLNAANPLHPSAPATASVTSSGSNQATVSWTAPTTSGPLALTGYAVSASIGAVLVGTTVAPAASTSQVFNGLDNGRAYSFTVYALNANGPGPGTPAGSATVVGPGTSYRATVLADAPSRYYRLSEVGGSVARDSSGNGDTGVYQGGASRLTPGTLLSDDDVGGGFDGVTGYVSSTVSVASMQVLSVEAWFRTSTVTGGRIIGFGSSAYGASAQADRHIYMTDSGQLAFGVRTGADDVVTSPASYNDNLPHHVVGTLGPAGLVLYVDGQQVAANAAYTAGAVHAGFWRIGYDALTGWPSAPTSAFFKGTIDEAAVYPAVLTAAQVQAHYEAASNVTITLSGLTPSFTLTGNASTTVTAVGAVSATVTTNDALGYTLAVQAASSALTGAAPGNADIIPIANLSVKETSAVTYSALSSVAAVVVHSRGAASAAGGDTVGTDYRVVIPFVNSDTYSVGLTYVAIAN